MAAGTAPQERECRERERQEMCELRASGAKIREIAAKYDLSASQVAYRLKAHAQGRRPQQARHQGRENWEEENRERREMCELRASGAKLREIAAKYNCSTSQVNYRLYGLKAKKKKEIQWQVPISAHAREILRDPDGAELSVEGVEIISAEDVCRVAQVFEQAVEHCNGSAPSVLPQVADMHRRRLLLAVEAMGLAEELTTHRQRTQIQSDIESLKAFLQSGVSLAGHAKSIGRTRQGLHKRLSKLLPAGWFRSIEKARTRDHAQARVEEIVRVAEQCEYDTDQVTEVLGINRPTVDAALRAAGVRHLAPTKVPSQTARFEKEQILASLRAAARWASPASNHRQEEGEVEREEEDKEDLCGLSLSSTKYTHFYAAHGGTDALSGKHPYIMTVLNRFGSWNKACAEAGLVSSSKRTSGSRIRFTEEKIFAELCAYVALADSKRKKATVTGYSEWAHELPSRPSSWSLRNRLLCGTGSVRQYSSWGSAVCAARAAVAASDSRSRSSD